MIANMRYLHMLRMGLISQFLMKVCHQILIHNGPTIPMNASKKFTKQSIQIYHIKKTKNKCRKSVAISRINQCYLTKHTILTNSDLLKHLGGRING